MGKNYGFLSSVPRVLRLFCGLAGPLESAIGILRLISRSIACKSSIGSPISRWKSPTNSGDEAKKEVKRFCPGGGISSLSVDKIGRRIVSGSTSGEVKLWDLAAARGPF